jgi:hypothetical protein
VAAQGGAYRGTIRIDPRTNTSKRRGSTRCTRPGGRARGAGGEGEQAFRHTDRQDQSDRRSISGQRTRSWPESRFPSGLSGALFDSIARVTRGWSCRLVLTRRFLSGRNGVRKRVRGVSCRVVSPRICARDVRSAVPGPAATAKSSLPRCPTPLTRTRECVFAGSGADNTNDMSRKRPAANVAGVHEGAAAPQLRDEPPTAGRQQSVPARLRRAERFAVHIGRPNADHGAGRPDRLGAAGSRTTSAVSRTAGLSSAVPPPAIVA